MRDKVAIRVEAGRGGDGVVTFRREKYIPRGGPDGGDGGRGGSVILVASDKESNLESIRNKGTYKAGFGMPGTGSRKSGRAGEDLIIELPPGTAIYDEDTEELVGDLIEPGDRIIIAAGGHGGRGNMHFATPQNRVPQEWEPGTEGQEKNLTLKYCIPADVAVIGFPCAGKSSLVRALTRSRTKVGDYPFATREPHIGVCNMGIEGSFKILDMPALVEESAEGRGIGNSFLIHLRRVKIIVYLLDASRPDGIDEKKQLKVLKSEVAAFDPEYTGKKEVIAINKIDIAEKSKSRKSITDLRISVLENLGLEALIGEIAGELGIEKL
jgi:GTPase